MNLIWSFCGGGFGFENWKKYCVEDGMYFVIWVNLLVFCDDLIEWLMLFNILKLF